MVLTSQQQSDVRDIINASLMDDNFLSRLAECVASKVIEKLNREIECLYTKSAEIESEVVKLRSENINLKNRLNNLEQKQKSKTLRITGISPVNNENAQILVQRKLSEKLKLTKNAFEIDQCYRIRSVGGKSGMKPLLVTFTTSTGRDVVYRNKSKLKGTGIFITEDLTKENYNLLNISKTKFGFKNVWTSEGRIFARVDDKIHRIRNMDDLQGCEEVHSEK